MVSHWLWLIRFLEALTEACGNRDIGERGDVTPQFIGPHLRGRGAIGEQSELLPFDPVFHLSTGTVEIFVKRAYIDWLALNRDDDEAGIFSLGQVLSLAQYARFTEPALARLITKVLRQPGRLLRGLMKFLGVGHLGLTGFLDDYSWPNQAISRADVLHSDAGTLY